MTFSKPPPVWRIGDFIAFALGGIACVALLIYGLFGHVEGSAQWPGITAATAAGFLFIYWRVILIRKNDIKDFVLIGTPSYGLMVHFGDFPHNAAVEKQMLEAIDQTAEGWAEIFTTSEVQAALNRDFIWVWFRPGDIHPPYGPPATLAGYTIARKMVVGFHPGANLARTAFTHELGHIIQGTITGIWDNDSHHARSKRFGLP